MRELLQWGGDLLTLFQNPSFMLEQWNALAQVFGFESLQEMRIPLHLVAVGLAVVAAFFLRLRKGDRDAILFIAAEFLLIICLALIRVQGRWALVAIMILALLEMVF